MDVFLGGFRSKYNTWEDHKLVPLGCPATMVKFSNVGARLRVYLKRVNLKNVPRIWINEELTK